MQNKNTGLVLIDIDDLFEKVSWIERLKILLKEVGFKDAFQFSNSFETKYKNYKKGILDEEKFCDGLRDALGSWIFANNVTSYLPGKKIDINSLTNEKIKKIVINLKFKIEENDTLKGLNDFLGENANYSVAFINGNDAVTTKAMTQKISNILGKNLTGKKNFQIDSYNKHTLDKQKMAINFLCSVSIGNGDVNVIISLGKNISLQKIYDLSEKGIIFSKKITLLDSYTIKTTNNNVINKLWDAHAQYLTKLVEESYARSINVVKNEQYLAKCIQSNTSQSCLDDQKKVLLILSEKQLCMHNKKLLEKMMEVSLKIGPKALSLIDQLIDYDRKLENNHLVLENIKEWEKIGGRVGISKNSDGTTSPMEILIKNYWREILALEVKDKIDLYNFVRFILRNEQYSVAIMTTQNFYNSKVYHHFEPKQYKYGNFVNRINFITSEATKAKRIETLQDFLIANADKTQDDINYPKVKYNYIVSMNPNLEISTSLLDEAKQVIMQNHVRYMNMYQGKKYLNNIYGNTSRISELVLEIDRKIVLQEIETGRIEKNKIKFQQHISRKSSEESKSQVPRNSTTKHRDAEKARSQTSNQSQKQPQAEGFSSFLARGISNIVIGF